MSRTARLSAYYRKAAPSSCFTHRILRAERYVQAYKDSCISLKAWWNLQGKFIAKRDY